MIRFGELLREMSKTLVGGIVLFANAVLITAIVTTVLHPLLRQLF